MKHELETFKNELKKKSLTEVKDMLFFFNSFLNVSNSCFIFPTGAKSPGTL